tara:strand:- start:2267 stop:3085 length:819 start_codon:yes stop_codon:yes gene_type:complete
MPELPEVETTRRQIAPIIVGRTIKSVKIHKGAERLAVTHAPHELEFTLTGRRIDALDRHGKYLIAHLDDGRAWVVHLRMTGSLVVAAVDKPHRFERAQLSMDDGVVVRFNDLRKFGTWHVVEDPRDAMPNVGPDALSDDFTVSWLREHLARRSVPLKSVLLDQKVAAGVGNIYADEACYIARINPRIKAHELGPRRVARLRDAIVTALQRSLVDGGTTFSNYMDGLGGAGFHKTHVHVFRRDGEPCDHCGSIIRKIRIAGRGTHFCPRCQKH